MDAVFDTTAIVDIDRRKEQTVRLLEALTDEGANLFVSTITVAEILTGANLHGDQEQAHDSARRILGQFEWIDLDGDVAEETGRLLAYLHMEGKPIEFQDVAIGASCSVVGADVLITSNEDHFERLPPIEGLVSSPAQLLDDITDS